MSAGHLRFMAEVRPSGLDRDAVRWAIAEIKQLRAACSDDIRALGWSVAIHNDYRQLGEPFTFWLVTHPDGRWLKGEGQTDSAALDQIRAAISSGERGTK